MLYTCLGLKQKTTIEKKMSYFVVHNFKLHIEYTQGTWLLRLCHYSTTMSCVMFFGWIFGLIINSAIGISHGNWS